MRPDERGPKRPEGTADPAGRSDDETAALLARWRDGYARLADISGRQFALVKDALPAVQPAAASGDGGAPAANPDVVQEGAYDELWRRLGELAEEREAVQRELERVQKELRLRIGEEALKARFEEEIRVSAEQARVLTLETAHKVESLMALIGGQLGSVRLHRKAMHAYYGMDRGDQVPLYFDEKK